MIDVTPTGHELWERFLDRTRGMGVPDAECISADLHRLASGPDAPVYDVVHCSGILYHVPDPLAFLAALRRITRQYLILTSAVTGTRVETAEGVLEIPASASLFVPALTTRERTILRAHWHPYVGDGAWGLTSEISSWRLDNFDPWWWLPTVGALKAMSAAVGFQIQGDGPLWDNNAHTLKLLRVD
jgi:hypothetical protein